MALSETVQSVSGSLASIPWSILAVLTTFLALYWRMMPHPIPGIPYNKKSAWKLLGDAPDMIKEVSVSRELNVWLAKQVYQLQAPLCQVFVEPFSKPWVLLADSAEAQDIMIRRPEFDRSNFITDGLGPLDDFHARMKVGSVWKTTRAWLQDLMSPSFLNNIVSPVMYDNSLHLVNFWQEKARLANDRPFDANEDLNHSALDGMLSFVFDRHFEHTALGPQVEAASKLDPSTVKVGALGEVEFPEGKHHMFISALYDTVDAIDKVTKSMSPRFTMWWLRQTPRYRNVTAIKRRVVREQVQSALARFRATGETKTAIEYMLMRETKAAEKQGRNPDYENTTMMEEIAAQFIAGLHTTSTTLAWSFIYMTRYPEIQTKLREALFSTYADAHAEKRPPSLAELNKTRVPYLEGVLEEALRLHATSVARQAVRDTEVFGHHIPKGTNIVMIANGPGFHAPSLSVDEKLRGKTTKANTWDERDLTVFNPERWLEYKKSSSGEDEVEFNANAAPQIAFGLGPRSCWGRRLAYLEMRMVVTLIIWNFDLLPVSAALAAPKASYGIVHRADQCFLRLKSRK
ncbi:cytochrome P450 [Penicillium vulpinum]|uniref:cytochrome P450 n=1 Tax=Penicillium vulpinum TaxID=29845 RepID=UPI0025469793|nr:cytochrome P450 [Penicillium vulpinum]KAJ5958838.1 cytochrome P450 [Penicillium vulpinum]